MKKILFTFSIGIPLMFIAILHSCNTGNPLGDYKGIPFTDEAYKTGVQVIPGKIQCESYDLGGEGISFHDSDSINSGSGNYNPADGSYLHEFRINESVDISYTKSNGIDENPYNLVHPEMDQLYIGWTNAGEWTKYTIDVNNAGLYQVDIMYTAHDNGQISLSINDTDITGPLDILSTYVADDTLAMRQWHHWNYMDNIAQVELQKGLQTLTLHTVAVGQMNYDYLNFSIIE